jgi:hypothetical protein
MSPSSDSRKRVIPSYQRQILKKKKERKNSQKKIQKMSTVGKQISFCKLNPHI